MAAASLKRDGDKLNEVHDKCVLQHPPGDKRSVGFPRFGDTVSFYHDVPQILHLLRSENVVIAACSRTSATVL